MATLTSRARPRPKTRYRRVSVLMWDDPRFLALSAPRPNGQTLWTYLLTGRHTSAVPGLFVIGESALAEALGWPLPALRKCLQEILNAGMAQIDRRARVIWLPKALAHNPPESPNVVKAWRKAVTEIPDCPLKIAAIAAIEAYVKDLGEAFEKAFHEDFHEGLGKGMGETVPGAVTGFPPTPLPKASKPSTAPATPTAHVCTHLPTCPARGIALDASGLTACTRSPASSSPLYTWPPDQPRGTSGWTPGLYPWAAFHHDCPDPLVRGKCVRLDFPGLKPSWPPCPAHRGDG